MVEDSDSKRISYNNGNEFCIYGFPRFPVGGVDFLICGYGPGFYVNRATPLVVVPPMY